MEHILRVDDVSYSYYEKIPALSCVSISLSEGEKFAVIGANGSGKSTLLKVMNGLLYPESGKVYFQGEGITEESLKNRAFMRLYRSSVGYVFQDSDVHLFCPSVFDELMFGPLQLGLSDDEAHERTKGVLEMLEISHLQDRPSYMLSGGEKKRVAIGSILTMNPGVLLLDEPMSGLDPKTRSFLIELMIFLNEAGKTLVIATHDLSLISELQCRVAVLSEDHRVEKIGTAEEILQDEKLLLKVNLIHEHMHYHGNQAHIHIHSHYLTHRHDRKHDDLNKKNQIA
ncbi:MAG TPA: nickel ABC transporter ATP-binding protein [Syntrophaceae bacterium]|nr:nickel ABC transporter ATP-binding protein [Syntrophaceae bacterium]